MDFTPYEFRNQPWFDQENFQGFNEVIPMKTMVVHCFDPRAAEIPEAVAQHFEDEVFPGENVLDEEGNRVGHTRTLFPLTNAGGRAVDALQAVATMDYLFRFKTVAVVHHSFCGATAFGPDQIIDRYRDEHGVDISEAFARESLSIAHFDESVKHDLALLRSHPAVPKETRLFGFFYEINTGELVEIARDVPA
ncbi:carbonic anhydrase [Streptomyces sp. NPDC101237]|uniref:carbonic anhydrase n=1 Tax=Streptomyces sp. NPDC101237 TaxID=3366139 RepID=UPI00382F0C41